MSLTEKKNVFLILATVPFCIGRTLCPVSPALQGLVVELPPFVTFLISIAEGKSKGQIIHWPFKCHQE